MVTAVLIGTGIAFIVLGMVFRAASEPAEGRKGGRKRLPDAFYISAFIIGILSSVAGVLFLVMTFSRGGMEDMKFDLFNDEGISSQQVKPESGSDAGTEDGTVHAVVVKGMPEGTPVEIAGAMATSEMKSPDGQTSYSANYAIDGDDATSWQASGEEETAGITLFLKGKNRVSAVAFRMGNSAEGNFTDFSRPRIVRIEFPAGGYTFAAFEDTGETQTALLPESVTADSLTVTVVDIYPGIYNTCISEISVY